MNEITIREAGKTANLRVWSQRVAECRGSGLPVSRWCQENGINVAVSFRMDSPFNLITYELCLILSQMVSARVGSMFHEPKQGGLQRIAG